MEQFFHGRETTAPANVTPLKDSLLICIIDEFSEVSEQALGETR